MNNAGDRNVNVSAEGESIWGPSDEIHIISRFEFQSMVRFEKRKHVLRLRRWNRELRTTHSTTSIDLSIGISTDRGVSRTSRDYLGDDH